jgi:hypothetical protein
LDSFTSNNLSYFNSLSIILYNIITKVKYIHSSLFTMFGKAKCKLCDKEVRFAIRHLKNEHLQEFQRLTNLNMSKIMKKYFIE